MRTFHLTLLAILFVSSLSAQPWLKNLPQGKSSEALTLFDYQQAFESYWAPFNVERGTYLRNGVTTKASGWKQFKRWEYQMQSVVNPTTGAFPKKTAHQVVAEFERTHPRSRMTNNADWKPLGPNSSFSGYSGIGRLNTVEFHPTDHNTYWVGAAAGGLWQTTDNGSNWTCLTNNNGVLAVSGIAVPADFATSQIMYIATGDRDGWDNRSIGVLKSTDGGTTWNSTGLSFTIHEGRMTNRLLLDPNNNDIVIAATNIGVFKTIDAGATWNIQMSGIEFIDMEFHPGNSNIIYGSTKNGEIYMSTNGNTFGSNVFSDGNGRRVELAVSPNQPNWVYAVVSNGDNGLYGIFKSTNSGSTFEEVFSGSTKNLLTWASDGSGSGGQGWYDLCIAASPLDANILLVGGVNTWRSLDGGISWFINNHWWGDMIQAVHADKHHLAFRNNGDLFECNDGGIYFSYNNGTNWIDRTNGMQISQMYRLGVSQTEPGDVITGLQDNGSKLNSNNDWFDVGGGDGMECLIDYTDVNIQYSEIYFGLIERTMDHWQSKTSIHPRDDGAWITPYVIDPNDAATLYAGYDELWKTTDRGDNWTQISGLGISGKIQSIAVGPSDSRYLYMSNRSRLWKTADGGELWTEITNGLPTGSAGIDYICVKHNDPNTIWVAMSGYETPGVYQTTDGGQTWTNISGGLPQIPLYSLVQNQQAPLEVELYLGTELGVYYKKGNNDWEPYNNGLPNVKIGEIEIFYSPNPGESKLRAATYGRGLWETTIEFTATPMVYISSTTVQKNKSSIAPDRVDQEIIKVEVVTNGNLTPFNAHSFTFNTTGSTDPEKDITTAKLYYTGTINAFSTDLQFGETVIAPNGEFTFTDTQMLANGKNNFWLTYDVPATAVIGNQLDAQCTALIVESPRALAITDPEGARIINFDYCKAGATELSYEYISNFAMGAVNNPSGKNGGGYADFTSHVVDMITGTTMNFYVTNGEPYFADEVLVWVDWNIDGDFDDEGEFVLNTGPSGERLFVGSFTTPSSAMPGKTRMRVRLHDSQNGALPERCGYSQWGEVEDYSLLISLPDPCVLLNYFDYKAQSIHGDYVPLGTEGTVITTTEFDNANSDPQEIGFPFEYMCEPFTQFVLNTNGFIKLGDTPPSSASLFFDDPQATDGGVFNNNDPADINIISPLNLDLTGGTGVPEYRVHTSGTAPNRVCIIQYQDVREANAGAIPQYDNMQFQIKLYETSNVIEFIYGDWTPSGNEDDSRTVACGLKGKSRAENQLLIVGKNTEDRWDDVSFFNANYITASAISYAKPPQSPKPDAGRTLRFTPRYNHDLSINEIYNLGDASLYYSSPQNVSVHVSNIGHEAMIDVPVTLNISGANSTSETFYIPILNPDEDTVISFTPFIPSTNGATSIVVSLPPDDDATNDTLAWEQNTNDFNCNYSIGDEYTKIWEVKDGRDTAFYAKYKITGTAQLQAVTAYIYDNASLGETVNALLLDNEGVIIGQSDPYEIKQEDLGEWLTLPINSETIISDDHFYAGLAVPNAVGTYFFLGVQSENPQRPETYYTSNTDGSNLIPFEAPYRFMIGAVLAPTEPLAGDVTSDSPVCIGSGSTLTLTGQTGFIQWQQSPDGETNWENVSGGTGSNSPSYETPSLNGTTYYRAEVTQPTFAPVYSNVASVEVLYAPVQAGPITGDDVLCPGQGEVLYTVEEIVGATSYVWTLPVGATGTSSTNNILVTFGSTPLEGEISVAGVNNFCIGMNASLPVIILESYSPHISDVTQPTCIDTFNSATISDLPRYGWTLTLFPSGLVVNGIGEGFTFGNLPAGTYQYLVEDEYGCISLLTPEFVINPQPATPPTPVITAIDHLLQSDSPTGNQWYDGNGPIEGATGQDYTAIWDGNYYVIVTENECSSAPSNIIPVFISSLEDSFSELAFTLFPNPVSNELFVNTAIQNDLIHYEILNAMGVVLDKGAFYTQAKIDTKSLLSGIYFIKLENKGMSITKKFVKE